MFIPLKEFHQLVEPINAASDVDIAAINYVLMIVHFLYATNVGKRRSPNVEFINHVVYCPAEYRIVHL